MGLKSLIDEQIKVRQGKGEVISIEKEVVEKENTLWAGEVIPQMLEGLESRLSGINKSIQELQGQLPLQRAELSQSISSLADSMPSPVQCRVDTLLGSLQLPLEELQLRVALQVQEHILLAGHLQRIRLLSYIAILSPWVISIIYILLTSLS